jgi:hypothetical protein
MPNICWRFGIFFLLSVRWRFGETLLLNIRWRFFATSYCLNRKDRVSSLHWTRGSKLCFLTCFSFFSCYFFLVFLQKCYSLISSRLSWLPGNPIFCPFLVPFIRIAKQDDDYGASNIVLPCPGS